MAKKQTTTAVAKRRTIKQLRNYSGWSGFEGGRKVAFFPAAPDDAPYTPELDRDGGRAAFAWQLEPERPVVEAAWRWLTSQAHEGWDMTSGEGTVEFDGSLWHVQAKDPIERWVRFERVVDGVRCLVVLTVLPATDDYDRKRAVLGATIEGHTSVNGGCFTRRGVDTSSCKLVPATEEARADWHHYRDLAALLAGEQARCVAAAERSKTLESVPGLPYARQPEWFATAAATLRAGKAVTLTPHGMGTGHTLSTRARGGLRERASKALEARLGVGPVYVETFDHD
jgi:hypothetical protein